MRRIPLSHRSHITGFQPLPTGTAEHESALEGDFVTLTSFFDPGASITSQPVTLTFVDGLRTRRYTPDFLVRRSSGLVELVEIKYRADLQSNWERLKLAFVAARVWARQRGAVFRIATERGIRGARLDNAKLLSRFRAAPLDSQAADRVLAVIAAHTHPTFAAVIAAMPLEQAAGLSVLWGLVARGALKVDLSAPITVATRLSLP